MWKLVVLLACSGCDMLFQLDHVVRTDGAIDSGVDAAPPCAVFMDITFDAQDVCEPWADPVMLNGAVVTQAPGMLTVRPSTMTNSYGGCQAKGGIPFTTDGIVVEVEKVLDDGYTVLHLGGSIDVQIMASGGLLRLSNTPGTLIWNDQPDPAYSPIAMRWWRLRRYSPSELIAEYSADGKDWRRLGVHADTHTTVFPLLSGGGSVDGVDTAVYRRLIMCN